jgi:putative intracellular protease/amidase
MMKKILMILASDNFRDTEYITPRAFFEQNNAIVMTAALAKNSKGRFGYLVKNDFLLKDVDPAKFNGIFIVGGLGILDYKQGKELFELVGEFELSQKPIGAICAAPRLLLDWEFLNNKKFTGWNGDDFLKKEGEKHSAEYTGETVEVDKNILTADGPTSVEEAALGFLKLL